MRYVSLENITDDMVLAQNIKDEFGRVLLTKGSKLSPLKRDKLRNFDVYGVYIDDAWSADIFIEPVVDETLAKNTVNALKEMNLDAVSDCAAEIVDKLMSADDYIHDVETIKEYDENTFEHCMNVAVTAVTLGIGLGYNYYRLKNLAVGSLLHDIGKQLVPIDIITKKGRLTDAEMAVVREHPTYGYNMLTKEINAFSSTREIVHQHHENWDGSGYPRGLKGDDIYELAMLTHVCDVFDALISKRSYKEAFSYHTAIEILKDGSETMFRPEMVEAFFKYVPVYHKGSQVKLTNGEEALVYKNNRGDMLEPIIKLRNGTILDLRHSSLEIIS
ncbi:MAG: HD-GYP domain-containing protein [Lachnospiraceae bacterium]|nr:HD-GYP domain-containing protein [Lachnospiraceae bacterium]